QRQRAFGAHPKLRFRRRRDFVLSSAEGWLTLRFWRRIELVSGALFTSLLVLVLCALILGLVLAWGRHLACPPFRGGGGAQKALGLLKQRVVSRPTPQEQETE